MFRLGSFAPKDTQASRLAWFGRDGAGPIRIRTDNHRLAFKPKCLYIIAIDFVIVSSVDCRKEVDHGELVFQLAVGRERDDAG